MIRHEYIAGEKKNTPVKASEQHQARFRRLHFRSTPIVTTAQAPEYGMAESKQRQSKGSTNMFFFPVGEYCNKNSQVTVKIRYIWRELPSRDDRVSLPDKTRNERTVTDGDSTPWGVSQGRMFAHIPGRPKPPMPG